MKNYYAINLVTENVEVFSLRGEFIIYDNYIEKDGECIQYTIMIDINNLDYENVNMPLRFIEYPDITSIEVHTKENIKTHTISWDSLPQYSIRHPEQLVHIIHDNYLVLSYTKR